MPRPHPPEFHRRAVELAREHAKPIAKIAADLGISESCLRSWVRQAEIDQGQREGLTTDERKELVALLRENRILNAWDLRLDPEFRDRGELGTLLLATPEGTLMRHRSVEQSGRSDVDGPELIDEVTAEGRGIFVGRAPAQKTVHPATGSVTSAFRASETFYGMALVNASGMAQGYGSGEARGEGAKR